MLHLNMEAAGILIDRATLGYLPTATVHEKISEQQAAAAYLLQKHDYLAGTVRVEFYVEAPSRMNAMTPAEIDQLLSENAEKAKVIAARIIEMFPPTKKVK